MDLEGARRKGYQYFWAVNRVCLGRAPRHNFTASRVAIGNIDVAKELSASQVALKKVLD